MGFYGEEIGKQETPYCESCPRGTVGYLLGAQNETVTCLNCTAGRYSDQDGRALKTEAGVSVLTRLATDCNKCPRGRYSLTIRSVKESLCISCNVGR